MKKTLFLFTLVLSIALLSGYTQPGQAGKTAINSKPAISKGSKSINKSNLNESRMENGSFNTNKVIDDKPRIILMLKNETGLAKWSPSLWWNYTYANPYKPGC